MYDSNNITTTSDLENNNSLSRYKHYVAQQNHYAYDSEIFLNEINKVYWNWHEISESDIQESVEKYNLKSFMQDEFNKAVWVCKIRE